ncbi:RICIN domain-containing protein [Actinoplanes solisilvae]|uniref:RICIN domain-containing protein n=1 Tax=Actinoplanes solisilvae TaxID=2486853 RepID=UPI0013E3A626|nr:RICIN domain-containing protein [Actinoplanes solisilvae]
MWKRVIAVLLLLFAIGAAAPAAAQAKGAGQQAEAQASTFRIRNNWSKLYLQNNGSISNGIEVVQQPRNTDGYQIFQEVVDGQYRSFWHLKSNLNMGINRGNTLPGAKAVLANPSGAFNQDWLVVPRSGTIVELRNRGSGLCLGIYDASTAAGAVAGQFTCDGGLNQGWVKVYVV